jgi:hypothetical protein
VSNIREEVSKPKMLYISLRCHDPAKDTPRMINFYSTEFHPFLPQVSAFDELAEDAMSWVKVHKPIAHSSLSQSSLLSIERGRKVSL